MYLRRLCGLAGLVGLFWVGSLSVVGTRSEGRWLANLLHFQGLGLRV